MRLWQTISGVFGRRPGGNSLWRDGWQASLSSPFGRGTNSGAVVNAATAAALPSLYRCCSFISDSLASTELRLVQESPDGGKQTIEDADAARALADWSFVERELFVYHACLGGNGFAVVRRNSRGGINKLESVAPRRITAMRDGTNAIFFAVAPEEGPGRGEPDILSADAMAHLKFRNIGDAQGNTVLATPPIVTAAEALGLIIRAREFQAALWKNGALPVGYLTTPKMLKQAVVDRLLAQWNEWYQHGDVTGKTAILEDGLDWHPLKPGVIGADSQLVEHARFGVEEVSRLYGVPPSVLAQTGSASYSTATEEFRAAVLHALRPWAERLCDCLSRALLTREQRLRGMKVEASLQHLLVAPGTETATYLKELVGAGVISTNEARNVLGYSDIEGGERHRVPVNSTDLANLPKIGVPQPKAEGQ